MADENDRLAAGSMPDESWNRMWDLFHEALQTDPADRAHVLAGSCEGDEELRRRIERLLANHDRTSGILEDTDVGLLGRRDRPDAFLGKRVGSYEIVGVIGEGGMGIVYEACQEEPVRRRVALKLIRRGMETRDVVARFEAERQALAMMTHATIAKVFDAGATEEGRPYFAMELVDGAPISRYCDDHELTIRERLELLVRVCAGVQHAHQKGVIHRDLKPSNVLVAREGGSSSPKIIDFGVAKATEQRLTDKTLETVMGAWIGTPQYMSPEQAEGIVGDVDTRTDVYALGVLLYELLSGALPFDSGELGQGGTSEIRRRIAQDNPPRPSTRVGSMPAEVARRAARRRRTDPGALRRRIAGDLDWIVMKALEKDRERRYGSVAELAEDIRRHLRHEPVLAGPPGAGYRLAKFVRRHRAGTAFASIVLVLLIGFAAAMGVQARRIARERDRATREAETARRVTEFLTDLFAVANPSGGRADSVTVRDILDRGAASVRDGLRGEPEVQARMMHTIGDIYMELGFVDSAFELQKEALQARRRLLGSMHSETAESLRSVGQLLHIKGEMDEARAYLEQARAIQEETLAPDDGRLGETLFVLAMVENRAGNYRESQLHAEGAAAIFEAAYGANSLRRGRALSWAGQMLAKQEQLEEGRALSRRALDILEQQLGPEHPLAFSELNGLAIINWQLKDYEAAYPLFERALQLTEQLYGPEHFRTQGMHNNMGRLLLDMGNYDEARYYLEEAIDMGERILGADHPETARPMLNLGRLEGRVGNAEEAIRLYERGIEIREQRLGPDHPEVAMALEGYAEVLRRVGQGERAAELEARAASIRASRQ